MSGLRSAASALAAEWGFEPWLEEADPAKPREDVLRLAAAFPAIVGRDPNRRETRSTSARAATAPRYLRAVTGAEPTPEQVTAMNRYFTLTADHGMNASTFTARVVASTGADVGAAIVGGIGALSGPLHGGAPSLVLDMLDAIGSKEQAKDWLAERVQAGNRLMGFGHRVYRTDDPRALALRRTAEEFGGGRVDLALHVEQMAHEVLRELKPGRPLYTNVEFYSAVVFEMAGIPRDLATVTFACSRVVGWAAHILEQIADNRLIRPTATYVGDDAGLRRLRRPGSGAAADRARRAGTSPSRTSTRSSTRPTGLAPGRRRRGRRDPPPGRRRDPAPSAARCGTGGSPTGSPPARRSPPRRAACRRAG